MSDHTAIHRRACSLCEAMCGLQIELDGERVVSVRGDDEDPFSHGYVCPKGTALGDLHHDPDRLTEPLVRRGDGWERASWGEALAVAAEGLARVQRAHGRDALAVYQGNPTLHSYGVQLAMIEVLDTLGTRACFSTASMDHLPHLLVSYLMFGHQLLLPVPDVDHTQLLLVIGANPLVSNGSLMSAGGARRRLRAIKERGGRIVVVDPRRSKTAELADRHLAIAPGRDALLLAALVQVVLEDGPRLGRLGEHSHGLERVREAVATFTPEAVAGAVDLPAAEIRALAREFAAAESAVCYPRLGACTQEFGALTCWLACVLDAITGNLDRRGGAMFTTPAADVVRLAATLGMRGSFGRYRSRVRGLPEFTGELPIVTLAEEILTPGPGQIRGLLTVAGNPVLSAPNGAAVERALPRLDFMVCVDGYLNETTRHANVILPPHFALERDHYDLSMSLLAVRNVARYAPAAVAPRGNTRPEADLLLELAARIGRKTGGGMYGLRPAAVRRLGVERLLGLVLRLGPRGAGRRGLTLARLRQAPHGIDLGPLEPVLPERLYTEDRRVDLAPAPLVADLSRLAEHLGELDRAVSDGSLALIGRRLLRTNNSWMHNVARLRGGRDECVLMIHPEDAATRGVGSGDLVVVRSRTGELRVPAVVTDEVRPGVVSLPHGFGHHRDGVRLGVATRQPGVSINDITDERRIDPISGTVAFNGLPVLVTRADPGPGTHAEPRPS